MTNYPTKSILIWLEGVVISSDTFKFKCGLEIPLKQIQWLLQDRELKPGTVVKIHIDRVDVSEHTHVFQCTCGEIHKEIKCSH